MTAAQDDREPHFVAGIASLPPRFRRLPVSQIIGGHALSQVLQA